MKFNPPTFCYNQDNIENNTGVNVKKTNLLIILTAAILLAGCNLPQPEQSLGEPTADINVLLTQIAAEQPTAVEPTPEPTAAPLETLTVCLGKEPSTLFFYNESSQAMWSVLEGLYDGPFDYVDGEAVPVIFDEVTSEEETVTVIKGDIVANSDREPVEMKIGMSFMPAEPAEGCEGSACLASYTNVTESVEMKRTVITFRLKEGLKWSDGTPLTAEDSVFSMTVNGMKGINASTRVYNLTESYTALDDRTVQWVGIPGYTPDSAADVFWTPLPKHVMQGMTAEEILADESVNHSPLGWGAYRVLSWEAGSSITLERNPEYFGEAPYFDRVVYQFFGSAGDNNLEALKNGTCDIIDTSVGLQADLEPILEDVRDGKLSVYIRPELSRQEVVFNLASTDSAAAKYFNTEAVRTAIAQCVNRESINRQVLYGQSEVPADFYPAEYSLHNGEVSAVKYDPESAKEALTNAGWVESEDGSARTAQQAAGMLAGTAFSFELTVSNSAESVKAAEMIKEDLAACGIDVTVNALPLGELYAQGPDGEIFGRTFDAAMFSWASGYRPCSLYLSTKIPSEENHWVGTNVGGYSSEEYDEACLYGDAAAVYAEELPALPLYFNISIGASTNNICGLADTIGSRSLLWNIESLSRSDTACAVSQWHNIYE